MKRVIILCSEVQVLFSYGKRKILSQLNSAGFEYQHEWISYLIVDSIVVQSGVKHEVY